MGKNIQVLFQKYLKDECSEAEIQRLLHHFNIQEDREALKAVILENMHTEVDETSLDLEDIDTRLDSIYHKLQEHVVFEPARRSVIRSNWFRVAVAAVIILLPGLGFLFRKQINFGEDRQSLIAKNNILPGKNSALLRLSDGREIVLNDAANGKIAEQAGMQISKTANGQLIYRTSRNNAPDGKVLYNTIETPAGGQWQLILADQSHVWLNAKSSITFPTSFKGKERKVTVTGEVYFEVAANKTMPFKVVSPKQTVDVLGTSFNVMAYADESSEKTTLLEGAVKVNAKGTSMRLSPGQQARVNAANITVESRLDLEEVVAWKNGYFKFNERLEDIMHKIGRWYNVDIVYENAHNRDMIFEGEISRNRDLNEILKMMEYTGKINFSVKGRSIVVEN